MQAQAKSKLVEWGGYLGLTFLLVLPISVLMVRAGMWQQGLLLYALSGAGAALLLLLFVVLFVLPRFAQWRSNILMRSALVLPGTILLFMATAGGGDYPPIHDITTDTLDPPVFTAAAELRGESANPLSIKPDTISQQIKAYPGLASLYNDDSLPNNFQRAKETATKLGWEVHHQDPDNGTIEAVVTTSIMAFKDDVVIRLRNDGEQTRIDLRSVSRVGVSDLGANRKRIRAFQQAFQR